MDQAWKSRARRAKRDQGMAKKLYTGFKLSSPNPQLLPPKPWALTCQCIRAGGGKAATPAKPPGPRRSSGCCPPAAVPGAAARGHPGWQGSTPGAAQRRPGRDPPPPTPRPGGAGRRARRRGGPGGAGGAGGTAGRGFGWAGRGCRSAGCPGAPPGGRERENPVGGEESLIPTSPSILPFLYFPPCVCDFRNELSRLPCKISSSYAYRSCLNFVRARSRSGVFSVRVEN